MEKIKAQVQAYFDKNAEMYISILPFMSEEDKNHIVNIGTSIICTRHNIGYPGGSFVNAIVNNDLQGACANADATNVHALKFYCMMIYNMPVNL
jgi:hypothetical protein